MLRKKILKILTMFALFVVRICLETDHAKNFLAITFSTLLVCDHGSRGSKPVLLVEWTFSELQPKMEDQMLEPTSFRLHNSQLMLGLRDLQAIWDLCLCRLFSCNIFKIFSKCPFWMVKMVKQRIQVIKQTGRNLDPFLHRAQHQVLNNFHHLLSLFLHTYSPSWTHPRCPCHRCPLRFFFNPSPMLNYACWKGMRGKVLKRDSNVWTMSKHWSTQRPSDCSSTTTWRSTLNPLAMLALKPKRKLFLSPALKYRNHPLLVIRFPIARCLAQ